MRVTDSLTASPKAESNTKNSSKTQWIGTRLAVCLHGFLRQMGHFLTGMSNRVEHQNEPKRPQSDGRFGSFWCSTRPSEDTCTNYHDVDYNQCLCLPKAELNTKNSTKSLTQARVFGAQLVLQEKNRRVLSHRSFRSGRVFVDWGQSLAEISVYTKIIPADGVGGPWTRNQRAVGVTAVLASEGAGRVTVVARQADN